MNLGRRGCVMVSRVAPAHMQSLLSLGVTAVIIKAGVECQGPHQRALLRTLDDSRRFTYIHNVLFVVSWQHMDHHDCLHGAVILSLNALMKVVH